MAAERGFSLIEMVTAMALMMGSVGSVFSLLHPAQGAFSTEPEE
jgi:prepilin-type N-terminal cleavage/methylation domain-containing protein